MKAWEREKRIADYLQEHGSAAITEICELTGASIATTRRDFEQMRQKGLAQRTHGGLQRIACKEEKGYLQGTAIASEIDEEKQRIAQEAASQVVAGESVFIGAGKTCNMLASLLRDVERLTVVTTSITAVLELADCPNVTVVLLGGDVHAGVHFIETVDPNIHVALRNYYFDKVFITVDGIDLERGYTVNDKNQTGLYTQLSRMTRRFYILADSAKFDRRAFASVFAADKACRMITTQGMPKKFADFYARQGIPCTALAVE
ncbi:MAG: DeoR/GlpR family DNA-binding transcription regulator [Oscillospiraceae bacterium]|jgi:DeoR/GlpR family transcriptional regulator of sugar metabolism|nr:DeoR/GlpR family DNA-binding transcription regulator [Oscillospiraceae bacterium]